MKPMKLQKMKKLTIQKETLRTLTDSDLARVGGGAYAPGPGYQVSNATAWCSTRPNSKCFIDGTL